jgi:hypothetical protein
MTRRRPSEAQIQRAVIELLAWCARPGVFAFHVPLGGYRSPVEAAVFKGIGTRAGIPDVIILFEGVCYALELKAESGRVSDVQQVTHDRMRQAGAIVAPRTESTKRSRSCRHGDCYDDRPREKLHDSHAGQSGARTSPPQTSSGTQGA